MRARRRSRLMAAVVGLTAALGAAVVASPGAGAGPSLRARAVLVGAPGTGISGEVRFTQKRTEENFPVPGVLVEAKVRGLSPGPHGFHIHENGTCSPTFAAAGGHFDPTHPGDLENVDHPWHLGDLPNLVANHKGRAHLRHETSRVTLSPGQLSVFDPPPERGGTPGSAVVVHAGPDEGVPTKAGGARIACGVIVRER